MRSDGDAFPETAAAWCKDHGRNLLALSEHDVLAEGVKWIAVDSGSARMAEYQRYLGRFGEEWVDREERGGTLEVQLKTPAEFRTLFEQARQFVLVRSEEITDR